MNQALRDAYTPAALAALAPRYGVTPEAVEPLGGFESFVFAYARGEQEFILKITHSLAREVSYLEGELAWLNDLAELGVPVARPVASEAGRWIETWEDASGTFLAIAYEKAPGAAITDADLGPTLYRAWGRLLGRMHAVTRAHPPRGGARERLHWDELTRRWLQLPAGHDWFHARAEALFARLKALPQGPEAYGLVHGDAHFGNVHWDGERLTLFDFDDAHHTWFANDLAITLYYVARRAVRAGEAPEPLTRAFLGPFLEGYREEHALDDAWLARLPDFLRLRRLVLYAVLYQAFEPGPPPEREARLLAAMREDIERDREVVELDFAAFGIARAETP